jgi:hypothetical protein
MRYFNIIAAYLDDAGVYEWQGEAEDYDDAVRAAQQQAFEDNCPTAAADGEEPYDMLDEEQLSVMDVTDDVRTRHEAARLLRLASWHIDEQGSRRCQHIALRLESGPLR